MAYNQYLPKKVELKPKRHHGFQVLLFILGMLLPPLAVAARFGIGRDFFINIVMTICGYFPGHGHNFYIQNIRNNTNKARTPKWALRYGLVNSADTDRKAARSQWAKRYDERVPESTLVGQELADGEEGPNYDPRSENQTERRRNEGLWGRDEEEYYNNDDEAPNQKNWHYPANFEGTIGDGRSKRRQQSSSGSDRWERSRQARSNSGSSGDSYGTYPPAAATDDDVPEWGRDYGGKRRSSKNKKSSGNIRKQSYADDDSYRGNSGGGSSSNAPPKKKSPDDVFNHEF